MLGRGAGPESARAAVAVLARDGAAVLEDEIEDLLRHVAHLEVVGGAQAHMAAGAEQGLDLALRAGGDGVRPRRLLGLRVEGRLPARSGRRRPIRDDRKFRRAARTDGRCRPQ